MYLDKAVVHDGLRVGEGGVSLVVGLEGDQSTARIPLEVNLNRGYRVQMAVHFLVGGTG